MKVRLFSNGSDTEKAFRTLKRSRRYDLTVETPEDPLAAIEACERDAVVYFDVSHLEEHELPRLARRLSKRARCPFGFIHTEERLGDPSRVMFAGAADVVGPEVLEQGITAKRLDELLRFTRNDTGEAAAERLVLDEAAEESSSLPGTERRDERHIISRGGWDGIEASKEYTFWLLFAELDNLGAVARNASASHTEELIVAFRKHLVATSSSYGGRIWIWKKAGGILLFPFDGERCTPIVPVMRLTLNRAIAAVERYPLKSSLSFRLALHLGNTVFESEGRTGSIVSETVNFVFHLGQRYLEAGDIVLTEEALRFLPTALEPYFRVGERFEGHEIHRLRRLVHPRTRV
ncbi:MAG: hypothetical protein ACLFUM_07450 [Spirochaetaceae bacterium]